MSGDLVTTSTATDHVAVVELRRPPNNFFSLAMIADGRRPRGPRRDRGCRAVVLAEGKHFCAGRRLLVSRSPPTPRPTSMRAAVRLFRTRTPIVAAVQGAAIGGGLGAGAGRRLPGRRTRGAVQRELRPSRLPPGVRPQRHPARDRRSANGRRAAVHRTAHHGAEAAAAIGLVDRLVALDDLLRAAAHDVAAEIAGSAPLAVESIRATLRGDLADRVAAATDHELRRAGALPTDSRLREGTLAMAERRPADLHRR